MNSTVRIQSLRNAWRTAGALFAALAANAAAVTVTGFNNSVWPRTDASMGIAGYVIEDFEDTTLASGLQVQFTSSLGSYGPVSTLPFTFDSSMDPGTAFNASLMWDGTHGLINRPSMPLTSYGNDGGWGNFDLLFSGGVSSLGFSYGQAEFGILISLDFGSGFTSTFNSATYLPGSSGRNGYLRIDAGPGETIYGVRLDNQSYDGILYDHLAYQPVPSPTPEGGGTFALLGMGLLASAGFLRRKCTRSIPA